MGEASGAPASALLALHRTMTAEGPCPRSACTLQQYENHGHYMNLMNRAFQRVGIGIYVRDGITWLTEDFVG